MWLYSSDSVLTCSSVYSNSYRRQMDVHSSENELYAIPLKTMIVLNHHLAGLPIRLQTPDNACIPYKDIANRRSSHFTLSLELLPSSCPSFLQPTILNVQLFPLDSFLSCLSGQPRVSVGEVLAFRAQKWCIGSSRTFASTFCLTSCCFLGAMTRWPFLGPKAWGLRSIVSIAAIRLKMGLLRTTF